MSEPVVPSIIQGPAIIIHDGYSFYTKGEIRSRDVTEAFFVETDMDGEVDERFGGRIMEHSFTPVGEIEQLSKYFPFGPSSIGKDVTGTVAAPKSVVIHTKFGGAADTGQTITYPRGGITKLAPLRLKPKETLFGEMTITTLSKSNVAPSDAAYFRTIADAVFNDVAYDETKIVTDFYRAAYGAAPYDVMGSKTGFELDIQAKIEPIPYDDIGTGGLILKSLTAVATFLPNNLTQPQIDTLLKRQGAAPVYVGQSFAKANTDLVITGSGNSGLTLTATILKAGPKMAEEVYGLAKHRHGTLAFTSKRTWTAGVANQLFTLAVV
jgi:hypothetical protein